MILDMHNFDTILSMDWLSTHHVEIWCFEIVIVFYLRSEKKFRYINKLSKMNFAILISVNN